MATCSRDLLGWGTRGEARGGAGRGGEGGGEGPCLASSGRAASSSYFGATLSPQSLAAPPIARSCYARIDYTLIRPSRALCQRCGTITSTLCYTLRFLHSRRIFPGHPALHLLLAW
ncbi:hypothetical protein RR48_11981 [Papilio machaon]|uniref:Uncharacterized protein n=1 Tax=Papilio machaon TaxID=76193 RepID=A0A194RJX6_PAPMA|nr:hypothetical protein RR48_11981 [Papilio machaon]